MLAVNAGRAVIINNSVPTCSSVSEYDEAMLLEFIDNAKLLVNTLGYKVFETIDDSNIRQTNTQEYFFITAVRGADAKGLIVSDGFAVLKGTKIADSTVPSMSSNLKKLRNSLIEKGIIDEKFEFSKDYIFTSPFYLFYCF